MNKWDNDAPMVDMKGPEDVEVKITYVDGKIRLWVNVDGTCRLRIYDITPTAYHYVEDHNG